MPVPSQGHYGFAVTITVFKYRNKIGKIVVKAVLELEEKFITYYKLPRYNCSEFGNFVITFISRNFSLDNFLTYLKCLCKFRIDPNNSENTEVYPAISTFAVQSL
jgi:hypothetical protein